jgi:murein L,D-transpeptidase YcbB/YkuD
MMRLNLANLTTGDLVKRFSDIGVAQDEALLNEEIAKFNRLYSEKVAITEELKSRPDDQRSALLTLYNHPNMQVRLNAATATLAVAPDEARRKLEAIANSGLQPQAGDAGMSLWNLDRGVFKPT